MNNKLTIGFWSHSSDLSAPGDRRRFLYWANLNSHHIQLNEYQNSDLVVATALSDFVEIHKIPRKIPILFDFPDQYVQENNVLMDLGRYSIRCTGLRRLFGVRRFSTFLLEMIFERGSVICSSPEQQDFYLDHDIPAQAILDFHEEFPYPELNPDKFEIGRLSLFWEGQSSNLSSLREILPNFSHFNNFIESINIVTDDRKYLFANKYLPMSSKVYIQKKLSHNDFKIDLKEWSISNVSAASKESNLCIIPINNHSNISRLKPENRTLIAWRLGLPVLASQNPSHLRLQKHLESPYLVTQERDWISLFDLLLSSPTLMWEQVLEGRRYLSRFHTREILLNKWDNAIEGVL